MRIVMQAHAKINWALNITGRRPNGYHELDMLMQSIELCDVIEFEEASELSLSVDGQPQPECTQNLIIRAAKALGAHAGGSRGARVNVTKWIPERAGLGGGSADCAATLIALNRLWDLRLPFAALLEMGGRLGADVPFCLTGGLARVSGIGECIEPLPNAPVVPLVLVTPGNGLPTQAVFEAWDRDGCPPVQLDVCSLANALVQGDLQAVNRLAANALTAPALKLMPEIGNVMKKLRGLGADAVFMTGSGSTVIAAFRNERAALAAAKAVQGARFTRTLSGIDW